MKLWGVNDKVTMCFSYLLREPLTVLWRWHWLNNLMKHKQLPFIVWYFLKHHHICWNLLSANTNNPISSSQWIWLRQSKTLDTFLCGKLVLQWIKQACNIFWNGFPKAQPSALLKMLKAGSVAGNQSLWTLPRRVVKYSALSRWVAVWPSFLGGQMFMPNNCWWLRKASGRYSSLRAV